MFSFYVNKQKYFPFSLL